MKFFLFTEKDNALQFSKDQEPFEREQINENETDDELMNDSSTDTELSMYSYICTEEDTDLDVEIDVEESSSAFFHTQMNVEETTSRFFNQNSHNSGMTFTSYYY